MADKGDSEAHIEVYTGVSQVMNTIEDLSGKIDEMLVSAKSSENGAEIKALLVEIRVQKNNQQGVRKRFYEFMTQFCESHDYQSPEVFTSSDEGFEELKETIEGFKKEEDDLKERINQLMVKISNSKASGDVGGWTAVGVPVKGKKDGLRFIDMGLKGMKIRDNFFMKPDNCGDSTDVDLGKSRIQGPDMKESFEQSDDSGHSSDYEICTGTEGLDEVISDFEEIEKEIDMKKAMGLEAKMLALLQATKVLFKKDQDVVNKSLINWIVDSEEDAGKEWTTLKKVSDRGLELGLDVCRMLGDLMFRLSDRDEVLEKFHDFKSALESLNENKSFMVTKRLIGALGVADEEIKKREEVRLGKKKSKAGSSADGKPTNINEIKKLKKIISDESQIDNLLLKFYHEVYRLDLMLNNPGLPKSKLLCPSKAILKKYKEEVKRIDKEVQKLKKESTKIFDSEVLNFNNYRRKMVEIKVNELWSNPKESND